MWFAAPPPVSVNESGNPWWLNAILLTLTVGGSIAVWTWRARARR